MNAAGQMTRPVPSSRRYRQVPVLDSGPRRHDHLRAEENRRCASDLGKQAHLKCPKHGELELVYPPLASGATRGLGRRQCSPQGNASCRRGLPQVSLHRTKREIIARHHYRPSSDVSVAPSGQSARYPALPGGSRGQELHDAQQRFFAEGPPSTRSSSARTLVMAPPHNV